MSKPQTMTKSQLKTMSLNALATKAGKTVTKSSSSTVSARKAALRESLESFDVDRLLELQTEMSRFVDLVTLELGEDALLPDVAKLTLMQQFLAKRDIKEFIEVVEEKIKAFVFAHIEAEYQAAGEEDPANLNGRIEVPALGKVFCKEAAGYTDPALNEDVLRQTLPPEVVAKVFTTREVVVTEHTFSLSALMAVVEENPDLMVLVGDALDPSVPKPGRLNVRDL